MRRVLAILAVAVLATAAACGDSEPESASHDELVATITESCDRLAGALAGVPPATRRYALGRRLERAARALSVHLIALEGLRPDDEDRAAVMRYIEDVREASLTAARLNQAQRQPTPGIEAVNGDAAQVAGRMRVAAARLHIRGCVQAATAARSKLRIYVPAPLRES